MPDTEMGKTGKNIACALDLPVIQTAVKPLFSTATPIHIGMWEIETEQGIDSSDLENYSYNSRFIALKFIENDSDIKGKIEKSDPALAHRLEAISIERSMLCGIGGNTPGSRQLVADCL